MSAPDVDETEIAAGAAELLQWTGNTLTEGGARNIAWHVLVAARAAKMKGNFDET